MRFETFWFCKVNLSLPILYLVLLWSPHSSYFSKSCELVLCIQQQLIICWWHWSLFDPIIEAVFATMFGLPHKFPSTVIIKKCIGLFLLSFFNTLNKLQKFQSQLWFQLLKISKIYLSNPPNNKEMTIWTTDIWKADSSDYWSFFQYSEYELGFYL